MKRIVFCVLWAATAWMCARADHRIRVPGMVDGEVTNLKALTAGTLERLDVREGSSVRRGEVVAELNRDKVRTSLAGLDIQEKDLTNSEERIRQKLTWARANADYWRRQRQRFERLQQTQAVAGEQVEKTRLQALEAETTFLDLEKTLHALALQKQSLANQHQALRLNENDHILRAPVNGVVLETFARPGENVLPGAAIADILDQESLFVQVFIEEKELASLKLGGKADIQVDGAAEPIAGAISFFGQKAEFSPKYIISEKERQSLLYEVRIKVFDNRQRLKVGMPVTVLFHE